MFKLAPAVSRRNFIRGLSLSLGALALETTLSRCKGQKKLGVAFVGLGRYTTGQLASALQSAKNCYLAGIVTGTPQKAIDWANRYHIPSKNIYNYQNFDEIAHNPDIDIVYVVLPVFMHKEYTIRAAQAGKHVICEKPMALNTPECTAMIDACKKHDKLLSIGYRLHYEPHHIEIMRLGQNHVYGSIKTIETANGFVHQDDPDAWRLKKALSGGGALMDMGIYGIQASRYIIGAEPISVLARQEKTRPAYFVDVDETVFWEMEFPGKVKTAGESSYSNKYGYLKVEAEHGSFGLLHPFGYTGITGSTPKGQMNFATMTPQTAHMDDFANCIKTKKSLNAHITGEEGLKDMKVIEAIYRSLDSGKRELV